MMKRILLSLSAVALFVCCSTDTSDQSVCNISVIKPEGNYTYAVLSDSDEHTVCNLVFNEQKASAQITDSLSMPYIGCLRFVNPADNMDIIELPVAIEAGKVSVDLSDGISLKGTPLNDKLQAFLVERGRLSARLNPQTHPDVSIEDLRRAYSAFYKEQIIANNNTVLGDFLLKNYAVHLLPADADELRQISQ